MVLGATLLTERIRSACYYFKLNQGAQLSYNSETRDEKTQVRKLTKHFTLLKRQSDQFSFWFSIPPEETWAIDYMYP